jgi:histidinol dehydrogenase
MQRLTFRSAEFWGAVDRLSQWEDEGAAQVEHTVREILSDVRRRGDDALIEYTRQFDGWAPDSAADLQIGAERVAQAVSRIDSALADALQASASRIRSFHERQREVSWRYEDAQGITLGQQITPLDRVGLYVPGGKAAYPSSVLMNALPAKVAGVEDVVMVVPTPSGELNDAVLAAAEIAGVDRIFALGGAQAIGALAYGTGVVPGVDKIVGPGNTYVATAKRLVFGRVGIDMVAGPSEILIICDGKTSAEWIATDLFSQAEHDEEARAVLISPDRAFLDEVEAEVKRLLPTMSRQDTIRASLARHGALIEVQDLAQAAAVANVMAPEHLELSVEEPEPLLAQIRHAGAVFLGRFASEVLGDYCAGPNHVLPTGRTARFSSPLGVYDFQKRSSVIMCSPQGANELGKIAEVMANAEGLQAHGRSAALRRGAVNRN